MVNMFGCPRSWNAHIERKKSKCDYILDACPTDEQVASIEAKVNYVIKAAMPVTIEFMSRAEAARRVDLSKLPEDASDTLRIVRIGGYDDLHDRAENLYSDFGIQRYLDRRGIYIGMALCKLGEDEVESFRDDISEIMSWSEFEDYELDDVEW